MHIYRDRHGNGFVPTNLAKTIVEEAQPLETECFDILGIRRSTQDAAIGGGPCSGSGGRCYRG